MFDVKKKEWKTMCEIELNTIPIYHRRRRHTLSSAIRYAKKFRIDNVNIYHIQNDYTIDKCYTIKEAERLLKVNDL